MIERTLPELLQFVQGKGRTMPVDFFNRAGVRLFILRNEGRIRKENQDPEIERAKLWNIEGDIWMETERWGIETHQIETKLLFVGEAEDLKTNPRDFELDPHALLLFEEELGAGIATSNPILQRLLKAEISEKITERLEAGAKPKEFRWGGNPPPETNREPYIYVNFPHIVATLQRFSETLDEETDLINILEEEKEGTLARMNYEIKKVNDKLHPCRRSFETLYQTGTEVILPDPIDLNTKAPRFIPLETVLTLLEEQMTWANWIARTRPTALDAIELSRYIHKSGGYPKILHYLSKDQLREWEIGIYKACQENLMALLLSSAVVPNLNEKISNRMIRHQLGHSLFRVFYKGGLINQALFKYAWIFGWTKPFPDIELNQYKNLENP